MMGDLAVARGVDAGRLSACEPMAAAERRVFERDGYLVVRRVLDADEVGNYAAAIDDLYERRRRVGQLGPGGALHELSAVYACPALAPLVDHASIVGRVCSILGWNVHVYHSHIDVYPPVAADVPFRYEWHQDGGWQNKELETDPRPRLSVKAGYWLSDVSQPGRGNLKLVPGSHTVNRIDGPPRRDVPWPDPSGATQVTARPGDVVLFDRRIWHARSVNRSTLTRKAVFFAYTYRWVRSRDKIPPAAVARSPVRRQLFGLLDIDAVDGDHAWGHDPATVPLYRQTHNGGTARSEQRRSGPDGVPAFGAGHAAITPEARNPR
jgi:ectoine hydroxylase-related dioxygenase (phytanoyl-CoA dioxygenase family)